MCVHSAIHVFIFAHLKCSQPPSRDQGSTGSDCNVGLSGIRRRDLALGSHRHEDGIGIIAARRYMRVRMDMGASTMTGQCRADRVHISVLLQTYFHFHFITDTSAQSISSNLSSTFSC